MSDCETCPVEKACRYPFKPTDCVGQRKFWTPERRQAYEDALVIERAESKRAKRAAQRR